MCVPAKAMAEENVRNDPSLGLKENKEKFKGILIQHV